LDLTRFLIEKRWRDDWGQEQIVAASTPVKEIAAKLFENDWQEMQHLLPHDVVSAESYIEKRQKLHRNLLSGCCLGQLFEGSLRDEFRGPWLDIIHGMDELATYDYLKQLCESQQEPERFKSILLWLAQKNDGLLAAMEHSRLASQKLEPYWQ
jgi:triphosphatase